LAIRKLECLLKAGNIDNRAVSDSVTLGKYRKQECAAESS